MHPQFKNSFNDSEFIRFLQETLLQKPIIKYRKLTRGSASLNFVITTTDEKLLIKLCLKHTPQSIERLFRIYETLAQNSNISTAKPIRIQGKSSFVYNHQYGYILNYHAGKSLRFYQIKFSDFQEILKTYSYFLQTDWTDKSIIYPATDWSQKYCIIQEKLQNMTHSFSPAIGIIKGFFLKYLCLQILKNFNQIHISKEGVLQKNIIHGDFHNNNILFKRHQIRAFIDFEEIRFGCISEDLMRYIFCLIQHSPFVITPVFYLIKWISLIHRQFHLTTEEWLWGLHAFFLRRIELSFQKESSSKTRFSFLIQCYWLILRYKFMYQILTYLFRKGFFVK